MQEKLRMYACWNSLSDTGHLRLVKLPNDGFLKILFLASFYVPLRNENEEVLFVTNLIPFSFKYFFWWFLIESSQNKVIVMGMNDIKIVEVHAWETAGETRNIWHRHEIEIVRLRPSLTWVLDNLSHTHSCRYCHSILRWHSHTQAHTQVHSGFSGMLHNHVHEHTDKQTHTLMSV